MHPRPYADGGKTMRQHDHVLERNALPAGNMSRQRVYVFNDMRQVFRRATFSRRTTMSARIPGKYRHVRQIE